MDIKKIIRNIDYFLLDKGAQPIADLISDIFSVSSWSFGRNLQLGSLLFQSVAIIFSLMTEGGSFSSSFDSALSFLMGLILFLILQKYAVLIRPNYMNPLRELFWGVRVISIGFLLYYLWREYHQNTLFELEHYLMNFSDILFIAAIYFMSCQQKPPKEKHVRQFSFGESR